MSVLQASSHGPIDIYYEMEGSGDPVVLIGGPHATLRTESVRGHCDILES